MWSIPEYSFLAGITSRKLAVGTKKVKHDDVVHIDQTGTEARHPRGVEEVGRGCSEGSSNCE
jgi:hypothetical protein